METHAAAHEHHHHHHDHHEMPTSGRALSGLAVSATAHCLTGCAIGEIAGLAIGTALGWSDAATIALAVGLAFLFGYGLTSLPLLRAGMSLAAVAPIAFAADTFSIAVMEIVDNGVMLAVPGAMEAGLGDAVFWGALSFALAVAFTAAFPVNRWLISRGKGHAVVHEHHGDGDGGGHDMGPLYRPRRVIAIVSTMFLAGGGVVLVNWDDEDEAMGGHGGSAEAETASAEPGGLASAEDGLRLSATPSRVAAPGTAAFSFRVLDDDGRPVRDFEVESARRMHVIAVRRDAEGFQHLHPRMSPDGAWTTTVDFRRPGAWRVFADFQVDGERRTLATDVLVPGRFDPAPVPAPSATATVDGYRVTLDAEPSELRFRVTRGGRPVTVQPYLGARGHLVALREGDLAYLHVHPERTAARDVAFGIDYPSAGTYRLFLQFRHAGRVHTARFTQRVPGWN